MAIAVTATLLVWSLVLAPSDCAPPFWLGRHWWLLAKFPIIYLCGTILFSGGRSKALEADIPVAYAMGLASGLAAMAAWGQPGG